MKKLLLLLLIALAITPMLTKADYIKTVCKQVEVQACDANNNRIDELIEKLQRQKFRIGLSCVYDAEAVEQSLKRDIDNIFDSYPTYINVCENVLVQTRVLSVPFGSNIIKTKYGLYK